jgi:hypothetical protein
MRLYVWVVHGASISIHTGGDINGNYPRRRVPSASFLNCAHKVSDDPSWSFTLSCPQNSINYHIALGEHLCKLSLIALRSFKDRNIRSF